MSYISSTKAVPEVCVVPKHIAVIMDGNGRWAQLQNLPLDAGHIKGVEAVRQIVAASLNRHVEYLTLFAFPTESWSRPVAEVASLVTLFLSVFDEALNAIHENGICFKVVGDLSPFDISLREKIEFAQQRTAHNSKLIVTFCVNYNGRWDIVQALNQLRKTPGFTPPINEEQLAPYLSLAYAPEPDLLIGTGGSTSLSNFLLWQLAYSEMYFTNTLWPDFSADSFNEAIISYQTRERRFGRTSAQVVTNTN